MTDKDDTESKWEPDRFADPGAKFDPDASDAFKALDRCDAETLTQYLYHLAGNLARLGSVLVSGDETPPTISLSSQPHGNASGPDPEGAPPSEWTGSASQFEHVIEHGVVTLVASCLHEASDVLRRLGMALDDDASGEPTKLELKRRKRGRPPTPIKDMLSRGATEAQFRFASRDARKKENAIQDAATTTGKSRATVHRDLARNKKPPN